ncbi:hypothetical protein BV360_03816 [Pseudomonas syringae pv. actinidiae]|nr:hypothetical protein AN901_201207 [Pseudomonas syringae pv. theae]OSN16042.1 hypothetical protein BV340_03661 [Pseudomonas syringae pv. actinidiae]OSN16891.1 hypothetical protein BV339_03738 [Pseudomonas syringae pv. actinidiae]OSN25164.1 hypothetical protein BV341_03722 [Pseudomonas syringae pv. actinidiae]OSN32384.1 hypothetical protein BV343_03709 [Pseudomonas syringae pv. actinidiae]
MRAWGVVELNVNLSSYGHLINLPPKKYLQTQAFFQWG